MEAIPRLPMLSFQAKTSPENVDFASKLRQIIMEKFGENPTGFAEEIKELESLRYLFRLFFVLIASTFTS